MRSIIAAAIAVTVVQGSAGAAGRPLDVPTDKGWQHSQTGLVLMPTLAGLQRTALEDNSTAELDVAASFASADGSSQASIYIYRPALMNLPVWFDRSHLAMAHNRNVSLGQQSSPIGTFTVRGAASPTGMRVSHAIAGNPNGGTALAMAPVGDWLVAVRLTSRDKGMAGVDALLTELIARIGWPKMAGPVVSPNPIQPCPTGLKFRQAKVLKPDMSQSLLGSMLAITAEQVATDKSKPQAPPAFCRDGAGTAQYAVYRPVNTNNTYTLAIGDAGVMASVFPQLSLTGRKGDFSVVLTDLDSSDTYPGFNALPEPQQVMAMVTQMRPMSSVRRGTKNISLNLPEK